MASKQKYLLTVDNINGRIVHVEGNLASTLRYARVYIEAGCSVTISECPAFERKDASK